MRHRDARAARVRLAAACLHHAARRARADALAAAAAAQRAKELAAQEAYAAQRAKNRNRRRRGKPVDWVDPGAGYDYLDAEFGPATVYADTLDASYEALWAAARVSLSPGRATLRFERNGREPPDDALWQELRAALPLHTLPGARGPAPPLPPGMEAQLGWLAAAGALLQPRGDASVQFLLLPPDAARCALGALRASGPGVCLRARVAAALAAAILDAELPWCLDDAPQRGRVHFARAAGAVKQAQAWLAAGNGRDGASVHARVEQLQAACADFLRDIRASADAAAAAEEAVALERREAAAERARRAACGASPLRARSRSRASDEDSESESVSEYMDSDDPSGGWRDRSAPRERRRVASHAAAAREAAAARAEAHDTHSWMLHRALANVTGELRAAAAAAAAWRHAEQQGGGEEEEAEEEAAEAAAAQPAKAGGGDDGRRELLRLLRDAVQAGQAVLTWHATEDEM